MYISEEQKIALTELKDSLEKAISVLNDWQNQLVQGQKYNDASECRDLVKELDSISNTVSKHNK
jgi:hypothetical protein